MQYSVDLGSFFNDPSTPGVADIAALEASPAVLSDAASAAVTVPPLYLQGTFIPAVYQLGAASTAATETWYLALPTGAFGNCASITPAPFGTDSAQGGNTCNVRTSLPLPTTKFPPNFPKFVKKFCYPYKVSHVYNSQYNRRALRTWRRRVMETAPCRPRGYRPWKSRPCPGPPLPIIW